MKLIRIHCKTQAYTIPRFRIIMIILMIIITEIGPITLPTGVPCRYAVPCPAGPRKLRRDRCVPPLLQSLPEKEGHAPALSDAALPLEAREEKLPPTYPCTTALPSFSCAGGVASPVRSAPARPRPSACRLLARARVARVPWLELRWRPG